MIVSHPSERRPQTKIKLKLFTLKTDYKSTNKARLTKNIP